MSDLWKLEVEAQADPPKYWTAKPAIELAIALGPRIVDVAPERYCVAALTDQSLLDGRAEGRVQFTSYRGHIIERQHDEQGELRLLIEFVEEPVGPTWIASWPKSEWSKYTEGEPLISAQIEARSWWDSDAGAHVFEARFADGYEDDEEKEP